MAHNIENVVLFQKKLDELAIQTLLTGFMDGNDKGIIYKGGDTVKIGDVSTSGAAPYDRERGYALGNATVNYQSFVFTQDRAIRFLLDPVEIDESGFIATAGRVMGEFQRAHMVPEIDAYRISKVAQAVIDRGLNNNIKYGYSLDSNIIKEIKNGIKVIRETSITSELYILATFDTLSAVEEISLGKLQSATFNQGGIDTRVPSIDGCPIITIPSDRMYTKIDTSGVGYQKSTDGKDINFIIVAKNSPIAVTKQDILRVFDDKTYQDANSWCIDYRRFHDLWVLDGKAKGIYVNIKDNKGNTKGGENGK